MLNITSIEEKNPMQTNFHMLRELRKTYGAKEHEMGIVSGEEAGLIRKTLRLEEMDLLALRNLRDFTVATWASKNEADNKKLMKETDELSAITHVIDMRISDLGGEV